MSNAAILGVGREILRLRDLVRGEHEALALDGDVAHRRQVYVMRIRGRCTPDLDYLREGPGVPSYAALFVVNPALSAPRAMRRDLDVRRAES